MTSVSDLPLYSLWPEVIQENLVLHSPTGSRAYGLEHGLSDYDYIGLYAAPFKSFAALDGPVTSWRSKSGLCEGTVFELQGFMSQLASSSPNMTEVLWMDGQTQFRTPQIEPLFAVRDMFITRKLVVRMLAWAEQQLATAQSDPTSARAGKRLMHAHRLCILANGVMRDRRLQVRLEDEDREFVKARAKDLNDFGFRVCKKEIQLCHSRVAECGLPTAVERSAVNDLLLELRGVI